MYFNKLLITLSACFLSFTVLAQTPNPARAEIKTHDEFINRILQTMEMIQPVEGEDKAWLLEFLSDGCECSGTENAEELETCQYDLFKRHGLPQSEEEMQNMSADQQHKFMLLMPLSSMVGGKCPEHERN